MVYVPQECNSLYQYLELYEVVIANLYISIYKEQHIYKCVHTRSY